MEMKNNTVKEILKVIGRYGVITVGCLIYAVAFCWFFDPNAISVGGFTGIAQVVHHLLPGIPIGTAAVVMNIPLFIIAVRKQGARMTLSSLYAMALSSLAIDFFNHIHDFSSSDDPLLACICGGVMVGVGNGLMMNFGATTGGSELLARLLKYRFRHISIGRLCLIIDVTVIILYTVIFGDIYNGLYGIIAMFLSSIAVDAVVYGTNKSKMAYIISDKNEQIKNEILKLDMGVTLLNVEGGFTKEKKQMIMCAFKSYKIAQIKALVTSIDKDAFVIVCNANEIIGEGFGYYTEDSL